MTIVQSYLAMIYLGLKCFLFFTLVTSLVRFEPLRQQTLFLALLYTAMVAFLSYVFLIAPGHVIFWENWREWQIWLGITFVLTLVYFKLVNRFGEGTALYALLLAGFLLVGY